MIKEYLVMILRSIRYRKVRSWLTVIGIVIGIAAIVSLITIGNGLENAIAEQFNKMGTETIRVVPKGLMGPPSGTKGLTMDDADIIENIKGVEYVNPVLMQSTTIEYQGEKTFNQITGIQTDNIETVIKDQNMEIGRGRIFTNSEKDSVILGSNIADDGFKKKIDIRNSILIDDQKFKVVGIFKETGTPNLDNAVYVPMDEARILLGKPIEVSAIAVKVQSGENLDQVADKIKRDLKRAKDNELFEVYTPEQLLAQLNSVLGVVNIVLAGIAAISLLVGGIGIMNAMYTSVLERTRDIGIMKAIGARNSDILLLFLIESGLIGLVGGLVGVIIGLLMAFSVQGVASQLGYPLLKVTISWWLVFFALSFAFFVGVISGILPAVRAAKLKPVDALRYE